MINFVLSERDFHGLQNFLDSMENESPKNHPFLDIKRNGNSDTVVRKRSDKEYLVYKDVPIFHGMMDYWLIFYRCKISFSQTGNIVRLKFRVKWYIILIMLSFVFKSLNWTKGNFDIDIFFFFYCFFVFLIFLQIRKFKKFIFLFIKNATHDLPV